MPSMPLLDLKMRVVSFLQIVSNYDTVSTSSAYRQLSKREVDMITMECYKMLKRFKELLQGLSNKDMSSIIAS